MIREDILKKWMFEKKNELVESTISLISEDSPKNKFSIIAGKLKMIEEIESAIEDLSKKSRET